MREITTAYNRRFHVVTFSVIQSDVCLFFRVIFKYTPMCVRNGSSGCKNLTREC